MFWLEIEEDIFQAPIFSSLCTIHNIRHCAVPSFSVISAAEMKQNKSLNMYKKTKAEIESACESLPRGFSSSFARIKAFTAPATSLLIG